MDSEHRKTNEFQGGGGGGKVNDGDDASEGKPIAERMKPSSCQIGSWCRVNSGSDRGGRVEIEGWRQEAGLFAGVSFKVRAYVGTATAEGGSGRLEVRQGMRSGGVSGRGVEMERGG